MAKETATDQQPPGRTPATPDWHTPDTQGVSQTRGGHCWGMEGSTSSYTVRWRHRAIWKFVTKLAKIFTTHGEVFFFSKSQMMSEIWVNSGARLVMSGERSATNRPKGVRGWESHACACRLFGCLKGIAAQPLRYCRLTAQYLHHHQNAATPNKEGKTKQNRKNKQHVRVRGILLDLHDYCFQIQVSFYLI